MISIDERVGQFPCASTDLDDTLCVAKEPVHGGGWVRGPTAVVLISSSAKGRGSRQSTPTVGSWFFGRLRSLDGFHPPRPPLGRG
jgi:hypothetical protein